MFNINTMICTIETGTYIHKENFVVFIYPYVFLVCDYDFISTSNVDNTFIMKVK